MCDVSGVFTSGVVAAMSAVVSAGALTYDIYRRYNRRSVKWVQVFNRHEGGVEEFRTPDSTLVDGRVVKAILIGNDNTVEIEFENGRRDSYARFVRWQE